MLALLLREDVPVPGWSQLVVGQSRQAGAETHADVPVATPQMHERPPRPTRRP